MRVPSTRTTGTFKIDHACCNDDIFKGEAGSLPHNLAVRTDQGITIIDNSTSLTPKEVSVKVSDAKQARALDG
jgi:hypothetical protein